MDDATLQDYFKKSGDTYLAGEYLVENEHGFMTYSVTPDAFFIVCCYGDGEYWDEFAEKMAKRLGKTKVRFGTTRSPKSFERKFKYKITGYILEREVE